MIVHYFWFFNNFNLYDVQTGSGADQILKPDPIMVLQWSTMDPMMKDIILKNEDLHPA